jgi:hypothetical protein
LTAEGESLRDAAEIIGVSHQTVASDVKDLTIDAVAALAADDAEAGIIFRPALRGDQGALAALAGRAWRSKGWF